MLDSPLHPDTGAGTGGGAGGASTNTTSAVAVEDPANSVTDAVHLTDELSAELESVVRAVPGVDTLYATEPVVTAILGAVVAALTQRERSSHLVSVTGGEAGIHVAVAFGVLGSEPATEVCRLVFDSIVRVLDARSVGPIGGIHVTVGSIH